MSHWELCAWWALVVRKLFVILLQLPAGNLCCLCLPALVELPASPSHHWASPWSLLWVRYQFHLQF